MLRHFCFFERHVLQHADSHPTVLACCAMRACLQNIAPTDLAAGQVDKMFQEVVCCTAQSRIRSRAPATR